MTERRCPTTEQVQAMIAAGGLTFTELTGNDSKETTAVDTWDDWDLSAIVPAGTVAVIVAVQNTSSSTRYAGARKNGTAFIRGFGGESTMALSDIGAYGAVSMLTEVDANRVIELYAESTTLVHFGIKGYWS